MQITAFKAILARRINIQGCEDYENTFARMESDFTLRFGFKVLTKKHFVHFFLDNGVMTTPKRWILSFVFTVLCLKKSLLIRFFFIICYNWKTVGTNKNQQALLSLCSQFSSMDHFTASLPFIGRVTE